MDGTAAGPGTGDRPEVLDAHVHFWDPQRLDYAWLRPSPALDRAFLPEHLQRDCGERRDVVFVQADCRADQAAAEIAWVQQLRDAGAPVVAAVAQASLEAGLRVECHLDELSTTPLVHGVRRLLQDEAPGFALEPGFLAGTRLLGLTGLPLDLCLRSHQLPEATELARRRPQLRFVLDHLGKPQVSPQAFRPWAADLRRLAELPTVSCKLSGLATEAAPERRTARDLVPFLREAIDAFGPQRCMFGSDWPVLTTAMPYRQWEDVVREAICDLPAADRAAVLRGTAEAVYGIGRRDGGGPPTG